MTRASEWLATLWSLFAWGGLVAALGALAVAHRGRAADESAGWVQHAYRALAAVGFAVTWTFMLRMARADVARYPSVAAWAHGSNLFFDAYRRVTGTPAAWWWSSQLLAWALVGALFFQVESARRGFRWWSYLWVAMCVAVSVALPLFLLRRLRTARAPRAAALSPGLLAGVAVAAVAVVATPYARGAGFKLAMVALHGALLVPAVFVPRIPRVALGRRALAAVYVALAALCVALHVVATARVAAGPLAQLAAVVAGDPAQASISSDVVATLVACALLVGQEAGPREAFMFAAGAPVLSLGGVFALYLARRELRAPAE